MANFIAVRGIIGATENNIREQLHAAWETLRNTTGIAELSTEAIEAGANGTGYFNGLRGLKLPQDVVHRGYDRKGRMVIVITDDEQTHVFFDRLSPGNPLNLIYQRHLGAYASGNEGDDVVQIASRLFLALKNAKE